MRQRGFSLLELVVAVFVFTLVTGAAFALLNTAQQRFKIETQLLDSFQSARLAMDQIVRDVHTSGYPPISSLPCAVAAANPTRVAYPFAWGPNYVNPTCPPPAVPAGCAVGATCEIPNRFDVIVETDVDPQNNNGVEWVRYQLRGTTLFRGVTSKVVGVTPAAATGPVMLPYVENVVNNAPAATIAAVQASYPGMFPGGAAVPIFSYTFDSGSVARVPQNIRDVNITLIVMAPEPDPRTGQPRVVTLTGLARRINPD